jgi:hypothetical protein
MVPFQGIPICDGTKDWQPDLNGLAISFGWFSSHERFLTAARLRRRLSPQTSAASAVSGDTTVFSMI